MKAGAAVAGGGDRQPGVQHEALILLTVVVLGAAVRAVFLARWAATPLFSIPIGDEANFHRTALGLLGLGPPPDTFLYQPLYSYFLAAIYWLTGPDVAVARTLQLVIGLGTICLFYGLGRELGGRWVGRLSALVVALYGPLVFFEGQMLAPALTVPLVAGGLWCLLRAGRLQRSRLLLPAGVLIGLAVMARPNLLVLLPVGFAWWWLRAGAWRPRLLGAGLAMLGLVLGLSPSWIHNAARGQGAVPISTAGGLSFYLGNNPQASGRFHVPRGEKIDASSHAAYRRSWQALAEREEGRRLTPAEVSSHWWHQGLAFWANQPVAALGLFGKKLLMGINAGEMAIHHPYDAVADLVPLLAWLLGFGVVFPFAAVGVWLAGRRVPGSGLLAVCFLVYLLSLAIFYVADRYRMVLLPMVVPLAALGMVELARRVRAGGLRLAWPALAVLAVAFGLTQWPFLSQANLVKERYRLYNLMGKAEGDRGDLAAAERYFRRAIEIAGPRRGAVARSNLGLVNERRGRLEQAYDLYRRAAEMDPENRFSRRKLARLAERAGHRQEAIGWWRQLAAIEADPSEAERQIQRLQALPPAPAPGGAAD